MTKVWGLTGGIASGKSTVARLFEKNGIPVIDADRISRELRQPGGAAHAAIMERFGTADPTKLRELVFEDAQARRDLETILHPLIRFESMRRIRALNKPLVIYEAALLVETGRHKDLDGLIVVYATAETRKKRLIERDKILPALANQILSAQTSDEDRKQAADVLIENSGSIEQLQTRVQEVITKISNAPGRNPPPSDSRDQDPSV
jgi:dephospho-CoA kinase